jgi:class 3 adenylate cyclase
VAAVLNDFFRIVVAQVDKREGLINKFQGDAALAVFGAPLPLADHATAALATARALSADLTALPVDFGIGVTAGSVFAGNIGGESRYEYTVIGDPVNEAARLADVAKALPARTATSEAALEAADPSERSRWRSHGTVLLRGRREVTQVWLPSPDNGEHD